ncbi:SDR family NAD(P)-dependent oxidoreductase [Curtobacterium sp. Leaf261]|uniref:SDR family NAD(P)-dependent oxidoreductase n=1 Tax=Curtobacterium sp. Leaf261 TaxID=1736311 RepID=UPI0007006170|nr:SDR family oxidoreductase [Curtobacterium sp. Leaf261]KQO65196.1 oxidoreductase [Curtobacterium sp. Leaf261]
MDLHLRGGRAFISGSTQGIGFAVAAALAGEGMDVVLNGRDAARLDTACERLRADHPDVAVAGIVADFADADDVRRLLRELDALGAIDVLVNNVGVFGLRAFEDIDDDAWQRYLDVNLMSGVRLSRHLLGGMLERGRGRIVFVSSESGVNVPADMVHYGVTKAAMLALGNGLAKRTRGTAVTVNTVLGGPTLSDGVAGTIAEVAAAQDTPVEDMQRGIIGQNRTTLLERFITPEEIANTVVWLASPLASATNGAAVRADGGVLTGIL